MTRWSLFSTISKNVASSWEERVRKMESCQEDAFSESLTNQLQQTLEEETRQSRQERTRDAEFDTSMMTLHETFLQKERSREEAYRDAQLQQEKLAKQSEGSRDVRFNLANDKRDALFQRDCEARQKRSELYTDIRDRYIRERHDSREAAFRKLEALLQEQIDTTWRILELVSPAQIDGDNQDPDMTRTTKRYSPIVNERQKSSTAKAIRRSGSGSHSPSRFPSRGRRGTPSYIPVFLIRESRSPGAPPSSGVSYVSPDSQQGSVDYATRRWLNPHPQEVSPHREGGQPLPIEPASPVVSVMDLPLPPPEVPTGNYLCERNSERRAVHDILFWEQEEKAEFRFQSAEAQRDTAEATRFMAHDAEERRCEHEFQRVMEVNEHQFLQQESTRNDTEILRAQQISSDQSYRSQFFKQTLRWERQKHIAAQNFEDEWIKSTTARIEALSNVHKHLVEEVRQHQATAEQLDDMSDQEPRLFDWSCSTMIGLDAPIEATSSSGTSSSKASRPVSKKGYGIKRDRRYNSSSGRRPTPDMFKNRRAKNRTTLPMPVPLIGPRFVEHMPTSPAGENDPAASRPKPPRSFRRAQAERRKIFIRNTKRRCAIFNSKEPERARQFFEGQKSRAYRSRQAEDDRQNLFNQSQLHRQERFQEGQEKREASFRQGERHWQQEFLAEQASRDRQFNACIERLHHEGFMLENQRSLKFDIWCREKLRPWFAVFSKDKATLSPQLIERRFNEAETRRREAFEESGSEQQREFFKEEKAQWEGELARAAEFEELMTTLEDAFLKSQRSREAVVQKWNAEKEDALERSETSRDTRFQLATNKRDTLFQEDHDRRLERSEWYGDVRVQHVQRGRRTREEACQQLEQEMIDQFKTISCFLNDALATRRQNDPLLGISASQTATPDDMITSPSKNGNYNDVVSPDQFYSPSGANRHSPLKYVSMPPISGHSGGSRRPVSSLELYPSRPPTARNSQRSKERSRGRRSRSRSWDSRSRRSRFRSRSYSPPRIVLQHRIRRSPSPLPVLPVIIGPSRSRSRSPRLLPYPAVVIPPALPQPMYIKPSSRSSSPVFPTVDYAAGSGIDSTQKIAPSPDNLERPGSHLGPGTNSYSARFFRDHHFQDYYFNTQEELRTRSFETAEAKRDRAESMRNGDLNVAEQRRAQHFGVVVKDWENKWRDRGRSRNWRELARNQQFGTSQAHHTRISEEHLMWIQKKDSAIHDAESGWIIAAKQRLETLNTMHSTVLGQYREALTRSRPWERSPSPPRPIPESLDSRRSSPSLVHGVHSVFPGMPQIITTPQSHWRSRSPSRARRDRSYTPSRRRRSRSPTSHPIGFAPQILATKDLGGAYLPIPEPSSHSHNKKQPSIKAGGEWISAQRKRRFLFDESQAERSRIFEQGMQYRRSLFEINEYRRQREFKDAQRGRKAASTEAEYGRDLKFGRIKARLEEDVSNGESQRESEFQSAEKDREHAFQIEQSKRKEAFYLLQEELQMQSFEQEHTRAAEFDVWWRERMAVAKTMVLNEKMVYLLEERKDNQGADYIRAKVGVP